MMAKLEENKEVDFATVPVFTPTGIPKYRQCENVWEPLKNTAEILKSYYIVLYIVYIIYTYCVKIIIKGKEVIN